MAPFIAPGSLKGNKDPLDKESVKQPENVTGRSRYVPLVPPLVIGDSTFYHVLLGERGPAPFMKAILDAHLARIQNDVELGGQAREMPAGKTSFGRCWDKFKGGLKFGGALLPVIAGSVVVFLQLAAFGWVLCKIVESIEK